MATVMGPITTTRRSDIESVKLAPPQRFAQPMPMRTTMAATMERAGRYRRGGRGRPR